MGQESSYSHFIHEISEFGICKETMSIKHPDLYVIKTAYTASFEFKESPAGGYDITER
jgi:hypothetical protein